MTQRRSQSPPTDDANTTAAQPTEVLASSIERVTFHNADNGFCVLRIKARDHFIIRSLFFIGNCFRFP